MVGATYLAIASDAGLALWIVAAGALFLGSIALFALRPDVAVGLTIPLFATLPTLKTLVASEIGPAKDIVVLAALSVAGFHFLRDRRRPDGWILALVGAVLGLYVVNLGDGHGTAWAHGVRLTAEPLLLLLIGLILPGARRTLRLATVSLVSTACAVAAYGLLQQAVGPWTLFHWGYAFGREVRTFSGLLRSFGTFDEPFDYAAFLLTGLAAALFSIRRRRLAYPCGALILAGLTVSFVRTAAVITLALGCLWLAQRGQRRTASLVLASAVAAVLLVLALPGDPVNLPIHERPARWRATLGGPSELPFGRGVGTTGTAATRAKYRLRPPRSSEGDALPIDSGYLATVADVGLVGLAALLALFVRLLQSAHARLPSRSAWFALACLVVLLCDAVVRSSFTAFPTAFLGLLLTGVALAAADEEYRSRTPARRE